MENYYGILEVKQNASSDEIKRSFRNLAKKYHPDKNRENPTWAENKIKLVITAYNTLIDATLRKHYDLRLKCVKDVVVEKKAADNKADDIFTQVNMVLRDLSNNKGKEAIKNFEEMKKGVKNFKLQKFLSGRDLLDCIFLLAEEYERSGNYKVSLQFYKDIYEKEKKTNNGSNQSFFFEESRNKIKKIYCKKLVKSASTQEAIEYYQNVLKLGLNNNESAYIYKKISECFFDLGDYQSSFAYLSVALEKKPSLKGISRIQTKLNQFIAAKHGVN